MAAMMRMTGPYETSRRTGQSGSTVAPGASGVTRHQLGGYREYGAPPEIAMCCEALWTHCTPLGPVSGVTVHHVLPEIAVSLAFQGFRDEDGRPRDWAPIIIGPNLRAQAFSLVPGRELAALRLKPEWAGPLLGVDPLAIEGAVVDLSVVCPGLADRLHDAFWRTRSAEAVLPVLLTVVRDALGATRVPPSPHASAALDLVRRTSGRLPCERVASSLGLSDRHLRRQVHDSTGVSPKTYARALRFVGAMLIADLAERPAWADIAARAGYCDQSHLIRECVMLAGVPPRELHAERWGQVASDGAMADLSNPS
jgi:AraC-like DNA-binding protein